MLTRALRRSLPVPVLRNFRNASAAAATKSDESRREDGVPVHDGPSTSLPSAGERLISARVEELVDQIASLSLLEVADLNFALKKRLNIPDQPMMMPMMAGPAIPQAGAAAQMQKQEEEEADVAPTKTSFSLKLNKYDEAKKIALIKEIRACLVGTNLVQAKKMIESAPVEIKGDIGMKEAEELKAKLEAQGATCEIE